MLFKSFQRPFGWLESDLSACQKTFTLKFPFTFILTIYFMHFMLDLIPKSHDFLFAESFCRIKISGNFRSK